MSTLLVDFASNFCNVARLKFRLLRGQTTDYLRCIHVLREVMQLLTYALRPVFHKVQW